MIAQLLALATVFQICHLITTALPGPGAEEPELYEGENKALTIGHH